MTSYPLKGHIGLHAMQWTGDNLKELIEFTGKFYRFDEWFKDWESYENHVKVSGNIFKLFYDNGKVADAYVGCWIVQNYQGGLNVYSEHAFEEKFQI